MTSLFTFTRQDCDRKKFILNYLKDSTLDVSVIQLMGFNHIYVRFSKDNYDARYKTKTIIAHYDRVMGTEGANDNSFCVLVLLNYLIYLSNKASSKESSLDEKMYNIRVIFTDGEESNKQGSFYLASLFSRLKMVDDDIYVFDCMGRGTIPILSKTILPKQVDKEFQRRFSSLYARAERILLLSSNICYSVLPTFYSDNASFLINGIPAVSITMLPIDEVQKYLYCLKEKPTLESYVLNRKEYGANMNFYLPYTWQLFHTKSDNCKSITAESINAFIRILNTITSIKLLKAI